MQGARRSAKPGAKVHRRPEPNFGARRGAASPPKQTPAPVRPEAMGHSPSLALSRHPLLPAYGDLGRHRAGRGDHLFHRQRPRPRHRRARRPAAQCDRARRKTAPCSPSGACAAAMCGSTCCRLIWSRPCSRPRTGASMPISASIRSGWSAPRFRNAVCRRRGRGRLHHHPAARQEPVPQPAAHLTRGSSKRSSTRFGSSSASPRTRSSSSISTASISAAAPTGSRPLRAAISASRRASSRCRRRRCWRVC